MATSPTNTPPTTADRVRQVGVVFALIFCIFGTLVGTGVIGTRVAESSGGSLSADATLIAPAGPAFSIWSVIYLGLAAYTVLQLLPAKAAAPRHRAIGWLAAASMVLNAAWLLVTQVGLLWLSVLVILALAVVLGLIARGLLRHREPGVAELIISDGTFGLYLGWVAVATCANVAATLVDGGEEAAGAWQSAVTLVVLVAVVGLGALFAARLGGRWAVAAAMAWGLAWIVVGRTSGEPASTSVAIGAALAALAVLGVTALARRRRAAGSV